jgi:deoxyribodipyrimidine photolyase-related protein
MFQLLILPNQLFDKKYLPRKEDISSVIIWEHPQYFTKYKYNKKRITLHKSSMLYYYDYLIKAGYNLEYLAFNMPAPKITNYLIFDPIDTIKIPGTPKILESPNFLMTKLNYLEYRKKTKNFFFNSFYMWGKKVLDVIPNIKSKDKENRNPITKDIDILELPSNKSDNAYIKVGVEYTNKKFPDNYGNTDDFIFPVTHKTAKAWLSNFIKTKFENFGKYQDAIHKDNSFLFHSVLSTSINIGLINPSEIISEIMKCSINTISIASVEGYIRQLFWREYQRYCYIYYNFNNKNYFGNTKKLSKSWYTGSTNIEPVDNCINKAFNQGYLNHIERLMVIGNFMNLSGIRPADGFRWFMEFSCDSYEWVMCQNVLDMVFFVTGGDTMRRPYVSSSNYILKMGNYKKGKWCDIWDSLYYDFIKNHRKKLWKFRYFFAPLTKK